MSICYCEQMSTILQFINDIAILVRFWRVAYQNSLPCPLACPYFNRKGLFVNFFLLCFLCFNSWLIFFFRCFKFSEGLGFVRMIFLVEIVEQIRFIFAVWFCFPKFSIGWVIVSVFWSLMRGSFFYFEKGDGCIPRFPRFNFSGERLHPISWTRPVVGAMRCEIAPWEIEIDRFVGAFGCGSGFILQFIEKIVMSWVSWQSSQFSFELNLSISFAVAILFKDDNWITFHCYI